MRSFSKWFWSHPPYQDHFVVAEITFKIVAIISLVAKITFVVDAITFKVAIINSSVVMITLVVTEITFSVV